MPHPTLLSIPLPSASNHSQALIDTGKHSSVYFKKERPRDMDRYIDNYITPTNAYIYISIFIAQREKGTVFIHTTS